jgi:hypothetical protein
MKSEKTVGTDPQAGNWHALPEDTVFQEFRATPEGLGQEEVLAQE